jgi:hypothetical protein
MARELLMNATGFGVFDSHDWVQLGMQRRFENSIEEHDDEMVPLIGYRKSRFFRFLFHALAVEPRGSRECPEETEPETCPPPK